MDGCWHFDCNVRIVQNCLFYFAYHQGEETEVSLDFLLSIL